MRLTIHSETTTLAIAELGRSIARFGDGELRLAVGGSAVSQKADPKLAEELKQILRSPGPELVCIPNFNHNAKADSWQSYAMSKYANLYTLGYAYGSSLITRPDSAPWIDTPEYWARVEGLWRCKDVILVVGDRRSLRPEEMQGTRSFQIIMGPSKDAYAKVDELEAQIVEAANGGFEQKPRVLMCLGATATVLAHRLAVKGFHAIDLGHIGMFKRHAGQYNPANKDEVARVRVSSYEIDELASREYVQMLQDHHAKVSWGKAGASHLPEVERFAEELGARSLIDYGCGRGTLSEALTRIDTVLNEIQEYDPGIPGKSRLPKPAELVVCTDVLEHIEPERLMNVLKHIRDLATKGIYLVIALGPDKKHTLPDGRNAHLIVHDQEWWLAKLQEARLKVHHHERRKGLNVWIKR